MHDNGYNGIMLHRSCDYAIIANNNAYNNGDAGVALYESSNVLVHNNNLHDNMNGENSTLLNRSAPWGFEREGSLNAVAIDCV